MSSIEAYFRKAEDSGRLPPGLYNWLAVHRYAFLPHPGDFFRGTDSKMWRFTHDLLWEADEP